MGRTDNGQAIIGLNSGEPSAWGDVFINPLADRGAKNQARRGLFAVRPRLVHYDLASFLPVLVDRGVTGPPLEVVEG